MSYKRMKNFIENGMKMKIIYSQVKQLYLT